MTLNLAQSGPASEKKPSLSSGVFLNRELTEAPRGASEQALAKLKENLLGCTTDKEGLDLHGFVLGIKSATNTNIAGGPAMVLQSEKGPFLLYKEPYEGFHLIVSGLVKVEPQDAITVRTKKSDSMFLVPLQA